MQHLHQFLVGFDCFQGVTIAKCNDFPLNQNRLNWLFFSIFTPYSFILLNNNLLFIKPNN